MGKKSSLFTFLIICCFIFSCGKKQDPKYIIGKSIAYHDPQGNWPKFKGQLKYEEIHLSGDSQVIRNTTVWLDNNKNEFRINRGDTEIHGVVNDSCFITKGDVDCGRVFKLRNYYTYLWGLPMKLTDPGTSFKDEYSDTVFNDIPVYKITVEYDTDIWDYFIMKDNYRMIGYQFVKKSGGGEIIYLEDEIEVEGMKIPQKRSWYTLGDKRYLGTDYLISSEIK
ncbi:DUF6503 family protein [Marinigracilibium pacificum]|uniref:Uncharacterized protein n=1 Tax=Marinigracilibium pacificum TaxID=2729599 RepID=A0A848IW89_9BACT|nr:DUF6503 family protein [Marinigracilibium pacificum]NMM47545.1 hypothetical protein [Marinigracilibium pacificum]